MQCAQCGATNPDGYQFCGNCGVPLRFPEWYKATPSAKKRSRTPFIIGIIIVVLLVMFGMAWLGLLGSSNLLWLKLQLTGDTPVRWDDAWLYAKSEKTVCGLVTQGVHIDAINTSSLIFGHTVGIPGVGANGQKFNVLLPLNRGGFRNIPEIYYVGKTICVRGEVMALSQEPTSAFMLVTSPSQIMER
jgi:hypothetical protein